MSIITQQTTNNISSVSTIAIEILKPDPRNPRTHSKRQIKQIANSIRTFGFNVPLLIDKDNLVLSGHGRLLACQQLGWQTVPVIRLEHLTKEQARAFAIADNRLNEQSSWDTALLGEILSELSEIDLSFSLEDTGFSMAEIDMHIEGIGQSATEDNISDWLCDEDLPVISKAGDLWLLGKHRLLCGNMLMPEASAILMGDNQAGMIFTDPPYNVAVRGHITTNHNSKHKEFAMASGEMSPEEFTSFLTQAFRQMVKYSQLGSIHFVCHDWRHISEIMTAGNAVYSSLKNVCVWVKHNGGMGSLYRSQHELIFVFKHGNESHRNNVELGKFGRYRTNVWNYPGANIPSSSNQPSLLSLHPTVKPVSMIADAILDCSARGDIILDMFAGSGSTLLASEQTGRIAYCMEIDPKYVDVAIRRWQASTGGKALHAKSGKEFDALSSEREQQNG